MARAPDRLTAAYVNRAFDTTDTTRTNAAVRSGIVQTAGYQRASPAYSPDVPYDRSRSVKKQKGAIDLGLVLMGGYQFSGQTFTPTMGKGGLFVANPLTRWMNRQGKGGYSPMNVRARNRYYKDIGWVGVLSQSLDPNKGPQGYGQSSEDATIERYSTQETRMGTRATFTDEEFDEETKKYGRTWAGYRPLSTHSKNPHFDSALSQMYKSQKTNVGFARRTQRSGL